MQELEFFQARAHSELRRGRAAKTVFASSTKKGNPYGHTHTGSRADLGGLVLRSGWEANVARILKAYKIPFEFEPTVFSFPIKRGTKGYIPDFWLPETQEWLEVKGYFDDKSRIKLKRFKKYYPEEFAQLTMIVSNQKGPLALCELLQIPKVLLYQDLVTEFKPRISGWEG